MIGTRCLAQTGWDAAAAAAPRRQARRSAKLPCWPSGGPRPTSNVVVGSAMLSISAAEFLLAPRRAPRPLLQHCHGAARVPGLHRLVGEHAPLALRHRAEHCDPLANLPGAEAGPVDAL